MVGTCACVLVSIDVPEQSVRTACQIEDNGRTEVHTLGVLEKC